jgi:hypothetical protein
MLNLLRKNKIVEDEGVYEIEQEKGEKDLLLQIEKEMSEEIKTKDKY